MQTLKYTLEMDSDGRRFFLCEHPNGELEPLPPDFALQIFADVRMLDDKPSSLPLGTVVTLQVPDAQQAKEIERTALLRVLRHQVQKAARDGGNELSDADADAVVQRTMTELLEGARNPAIARVKVTQDAQPVILPARGPIGPALLRKDLGIRK